MDFWFFMFWMLVALLVGCFFGIVVTVESKKAEDKAKSAFKACTCKCHD